jgi:hypothetical protein
VGDVEVYGDVGGEAGEVVVEGPEGEGEAGGGGAEEEVDAGCLDAGPVAAVEVICCEVVVGLESFDVGKVVEGGAEAGELGGSASPERTSGRMAPMRWAWPAAMS